MDKVTDIKMDILLDAIIDTVLNTIIDTKTEKQKLRTILCNCGLKIWILETLVIN